MQQFSHDHLHKVEMTSIADFGEPCLNITTVSHLCISRTTVPALTCFFIAFHIRKLMTHRTGDKMICEKVAPKYSFN